MNNDIDNNNDAYTDKIDIDDGNDIDNNNDAHTDKIDIDDGKPNNGKPITKIEVSPNEKYLVTYSQEDNSISGWDVENNDEEIYDMMNEIENLIDDNGYELYDYCAFNLKGELILSYMNYIYVCSIQNENSKWKRERIYFIPDYSDLISISIYDKIYLSSNNSIYEWDLITGRIIKISGNEIKYDFSFELDEYLKNVRIFGNEKFEKFICTRIKDKIIIYSVELKITIASLDLNNVIQLRMLIKFHALWPLLFPLLYPLFSNIPSIKFWEEYLQANMCLEF
ncbi:hypothetical protein RhiirA4_484420 [Rhizophagus irregularis]|uniref:Uncharacterized protein n=1 Tax=Rhizophagus irregularis TaxID=588596 RepID=A0A2I1HNW2_9GLOM|nr:hypothetical protein RhiirA4_484420 [Rhizophagus irregularis]